MQGYSSLRATSPNADIHKQLEMRITDICMRNGVMVAPGNVYMPEGFGWFRVTFTVGKEALVEGSERFWRALGDVEVEKRDWE